jgi:hypothetical protein
VKLGYRYYAPNSGLICNTHRVVVVHPTYTAKSRMHRSLLWQALDTCMDLIPRTILVRYHLRLVAKYHGASRELSAAFNPGYRRHAGTFKATGYGDLSIRSTSADSIKTILCSSILAHSRLLMEVHILRSIFSRLEFDPFSWFPGQRRLEFAW